MKNNNNSNENNIHILHSNGIKQIKSRRQTTIGVGGADREEEVLHVGDGRH